MNPIQVKKRFIRIAPRKIRIAGQELKGLSIQRGQRKLGLIDKYGARVLEKMLKEAINILEAKNLAAKDFIISAVRVDQGPALKRHLPRSRGRISPLKKYLSHVILELIPVSKIKNKNGSKNFSN